MRAVTAALLWACSAAGGELKLERRGQDTFVLRGDEEVVFTTSVDDTSAGSDTDSDIQGDEEFFHGCLWTYRQQVSLCQGGSCGEAEIMAHDFQRRLLSFYANRSGTAPPPLEEAAWLVLSTSREQRREVFESCHGLMVSALMLVAEAVGFAGQEAMAMSFAQEAELYVHTLRDTAPKQMETMMDMFPIREAWAGFQSLLQAPDAPKTVDLVIARCKSPLQWLWELDYPAGSRVFVYDKCNRGLEEFRAQTSGLEGVVSLEYRQVAEVSEVVMTGECTAYLAHLAAGVRAADFTIFLHDDAPRHIRMPLLSMVLRALRAGTYEVPFLHLAHERYPSYRTPCLKEVHRQALRAELPDRLGTYCCSHFVVRRDRIEARDPEFYQHLGDMVSQATYGSDRGGACRVGSKPCYVMEFLWHVVFGEPGELPPREEDGRLPLALRYEGGRASRMPSPLRLAPYMELFHASRYSMKLLQQ